MIRRISIRNFKRFQDEEIELADTIVLAGPNNAGKSTLLQCIATWKFGLDRWLAQRAGGRAVARSGVPVPRADFTAVPLREMNLLWEDRKVTGPSGMAGARRLIEVVVEGEANGEQWTCGLELQYANPELVYARPLDARNLDREAIRNFPPQAARDLDIVHVPPLSGIERDEPRRDRGMQDLLVGQGRPGEILRNLLLEIASDGDARKWDRLAGHIRDLFRIELSRPVYSPAQPYIICEYREQGRNRPLDLSNAGSGTLQVLLLFAFLYARPAAVILLDEPDAHLHVVLQQQVYDLLRKVAHEFGGQIIVATHSEVVLDATAPDRVIGFFGESPRILTSRVERDQVREALKRATTTELLLVQEIGSVLYVENESDQKILSEWARILNHPAKQFFDRPFIHWLGGRKLREASAHFFALRAICPGLRAVCLLDGDNRDEMDKEATREGLEVLRWRRYEIENYLLHPEAIKRYINFPIKVHIVDEEFWKNVPKNTNLFSDHVSLVRVKGSSEFLIPLFNNIGENILKKDFHLLASVMKKEEIHPEIHEKLNRIAQNFMTPFTK